MATLASYNLGVLRTKLAEEFGLDPTGDDRRLIDGKINQAIHWIVRRQPNWPWLRKELTVNVPASRTGICNFVKGAAQAIVSDASVPRYWVIDNGSVAGNLFDGMLVIGSLDPTGTLDAHWIDGTTVGSDYTYTAAQGYFQLPNDFSAMLKIHTSELPDRALTYGSPPIFEKVKRRQISLDFGAPLIYTILPDPAEVSSGRLYLALYPYPTEIQTLRALYYSHPEDLVDDSDVPIIPPNDRLVLFHVAAWMLAQKKKYDARVVAGYEAFAREGVERMAQQANTFEEDSVQIRDRSRSSFWAPKYNFPVE